MEIRVDIRRLSAVLPHEETLLELSFKLAQEILSARMQRDPIIVDENTGVVLDGMHRLSSLKRLGSKCVVCHLVDYSSKRVCLRRWVRVLRRATNEDITKLLESLEVNQPAKLSEALELVETGGNFVAVMAKGKCYVSSRELGSLADCYDIVKRIDSFARQNGWREDFVGEERIHDQLVSPRAMVILPPPLTKQDVLRAATTGRLLPHKTTMHVIDLRPLGVDYPLSELRKERPSERILMTRLSTSRVSIRSPPYTHLGRTYDERVMVLRRG